MHDIPFFQTENGIASLILKEIVYKKIAYIRIQNALHPDALLQECIDFCRAVGAEQIFATGNNHLTKYPLYTSIVDMACNKNEIPIVNLNLVPADKDNYEQWRRIYNERMYSVPNAATITLQDADKQIPGSFFVYEKET
ncbi:MAG: hypothetical protein IKU07_10160, partial [Oscillospiraceae bacterium]|nr:hypothetical protein [Oscillospiraceae bacterium]